MATRNFKKRPSGSHEPKAVGAILTKMLRSNSPLAKGYRKFVANKKSSAEKGGEL